MSKMKVLFVLLFLCLGSLYAQTTAIPDESFEQALIDLGIDSDGIINGSVATSDINTITSLDVSNKYIEDLKGIEDFASLTELYCQKNYLYNLDLSSNSNLKTLNCSYTTGYDYEPLPINLSQNNALEYLNCSGNKLTGIGVSHMPNLKAFLCSSNKIRTIDVSKNLKLELLNCEFNLLSSLNVSKNANLTVLQCGGNELSSLNITQNKNLIDVRFSGNQIATIDLSQNSQLEKLYCSQNQLATLDLTKLTSLKVFYSVYNYLLINMDFSQNYNLEEISCYANSSLTNIDITGTTALKYLNCRSNKLTELDTSNNTLLEILYCQKNLLQNLDFSQNSALTFLKCHDNKLETLNIKNGVNELIKGGYTIYDGILVYMEGLDATNNPLLQCIQVDKATDATAGLAPYDSWVIDDDVNYSEDCGYALGVKNEISSTPAFVLYPNPVRDVLRLRSEIPIYKVEFYTVLGTKVKEIHQDCNAIVLNDLPQGIFMVKIYTENGTGYKKLLKK